jgi:TolB-like protein/Flp pilus assembly protein TadD
LAKNRELRYQTAAEVKADLLRVGKGVEINGEPAASERKPPQMRRWAGLVALTIIVAATGAAVLGKMGKLTKGATADAPPPVRSIAVLPLENLSHDPQQEYLAAGLTDELITNLAKLQSLRVIAPTSAMKYKSRPRSIREIAKDLKVDALLEGTVLLSGDRVSITTQLSDAISEKSLLAESYEAALRDVGALQNRIARAIIAGTKVTLTAREEQRFARVQPVKADAYLAYLHGLFYWKKGLLGKEDTEAAIGMFERAIALDSKFAAAYAHLASACAYMHMNIVPTQEVADKALRAAKESLSLDPNLAEAYLAQGTVATMMLHFPVEASIQYFQRALALSPNLSEAHFQMGAAYLHMGLLNEALLELNEALALDPHMFLIRLYVARADLYQQRYDEALLVYEGSPDFPTKTLWEKILILFHQGKRMAAHELALELMRKLPDNGDVASAYAILLAAEGEKEKAEEQIRLAIRTGAGLRHFHHAEYNIASAYALMGNHRSALEWLRKTAEDGLPCYPLFQTDPKLDNLRNDPGFATFLAEMKSLLERRRANL